MAAGARIWLADAAGPTNEALASYHSRLSVSEAQRYRRFLRPGRQRQFLTGRMLLRQAAGALLGVPAGMVSVLERPGQAPGLVLADATLAIPYFSLSHSGDWVACAISAETPLGLDIEVLNPARDLLSLAGHAFDAGACAGLAQMAGGERVAAFYHLWSEQEARYKLGPCAAPSCISLPHESLSIVLCSALPLSAAPALVLTALA